MMVNLLSKWKIIKEIEEVKEEIKTGYIMKRAFILEKKLIKKKKIIKGKTIFIKYFLKMKKINRQQFRN